MTRPASITCPRCGKTSYHPGDITNGYCARCRWWTSHELLGTPEAIAAAEQGGVIEPLP